MNDGPGRAPQRDGWIVAAIAAIARLAAVAWAGGGGLPGDARLYHVLALRIAEGHGYTWAWPDGAVTPVAHYPVGLPGLLAGLDRAATLGGLARGDLLRHPFAAQAALALVCAAAAPLVWALVARDVPGRRPALLAGALVALHPGLVLYAPAIMSEGPTATLVAGAAWLAAWARDARGGRRAWAFAALGVVVGLATLIRPQALPFAPLLALAAAAAAPGGPAALAGRLRAGVGAAAIASLAALAVCAPWTLRNCQEMGRCALVSVNGGWNLLIGSEPGGDGGWAEVQVPPACREVWDEAEKDACFGRAARARIAADPGGFLALAPRKLAMTFDYGGAGPWWLSASRPDRMGPVAKQVAGGVETLVQRLLLVAAAVAVGRARPPSSLGRAMVVAAVVFALQRSAWISVLALAAGILSLGVRGRPFVFVATGASIALTAVVHAAFFGAGRYQVPVLPLVAGVAALAFLGAPSARAAPDHEPSSEPSRGVGAAVI